MAGAEETGTAAARAEADRTEGDLLAKARGGNLFAFEEIVKRYQRRVYGVALRIVRRHDVADDVAQEAFIRAYQALDRFDTARPFGPWICRIAANLAINHVRSPESREDEFEDGSAAVAREATPLEGVLARENRELLEAALAALPLEQRAVVVLRAVEGFSYQEIADALAISPGTVMSRLFRARERLAAALAPHFGSLRTARGDSA